MSLGPYHVLHDCFFDALAANPRPTAGEAAADTLTTKPSQRSEYICNI